MSGELTTLRNWQRGLRISHIAHHKATARYAMLGRALGITVVVLSAVVGTAIFTSLNHSPSAGTRTAAGLLSVAAVIFSALQTFLGFPQRQAAHHKVAIGYGALRREIESAIGFPQDKQKLSHLLSDLRLRWDEIDAAAPAVPQRIWSTAIATVERGKAVRKIEPASE